MQGVVDGFSSATKALELSQTACRSQAEKFLKASGLEAAKATEVKKVFAGYELALKSTATRVTEATAALSTFLSDNNPEALMADVQRLKSEKDMSASHVQTLSNDVQELERAHQREKDAHTQSKADAAREKEAITTELATCRVAAQRFHEAQRAFEIERAENNRLSSAIDALQSRFAHERQEWEARLVDMGAQRLHAHEQAAVLQGASADALREHISSLVEENRELRMRATYGSSPRGERPPAAAPDRDPVAATLRSTIEGLQRECRDLADRNRALTEEREALNARLHEAQIASPAPRQASPSHREKVLAAAHATPARMQQVPERSIRHVGTQARDDAGLALVQKASLLASRLQAADAERVVLRERLVSAECQLSRGTEDSLREQVETLQVELRRKSYRVCKLQGELDELRASSSSSYREALADAERRCAAAELDRLSLQKRLQASERSRSLDAAQFAAARSVVAASPPRDSPPRAAEDEAFRAVSAHLADLDQREAAARAAFAAQEAALEQDLAHLEAAMDYWRSASSGAGGSGPVMIGDTRTRIQEAQDSLWQLKQEKAATLDRLVAERQRLVRHQADVLQR